MRVGLALLGVLVAVLAGGRARAQHGRVALVEPAAALEAAVHDALEPWGVEIVRVPPPSPGAVMPSSSDAARRIAEAHSADAVVWISSIDSGHALWVYDVGEDHVVARSLVAAPPFDDASAASVALSVKTLLRHSRVAPEPERWAAAAESFGDPSPPDRLPPPPAPAPSAAEAAAEPLVVDDRQRWFLRGALGGRFLRTRPAAFEPRLSLGLLGRPFETELVGVALDLTSGPGIAAVDDRFDGHLTDTEAFVSIVLRVPERSAVGLGAELGAGVVLTLLDGVLLENAMPVSVWRANLALRGAVGLDHRLGPSFRVGLHGGVSWLARRQRYLVHGEEVLRLRTFAFDIGLRLEAVIL